jgi:hypothetical protein
MVATIIWWKQFCTLDETVHVMVSNASSFDPFAKADLGPNRRPAREVLRA